MQLDMHYYGTYCIARAAGLNQETAETIAKCAEYVDDSDSHNIEVKDHPDGGKFSTVVTAHTNISGQNRNLDDQRLVWVPFHFLPGNEGDTFSRRLVCCKDSDIAREMVEHHLEFESDFSPELVGIGMHVYADTFAHYGFAGISSRINRIDASSLKLVQSDSVVENFLGKKLGDWISKWGGLVDNYRMLSNIGGELATGALGHSGVLTYPDTPFLEWEYKYEFPELTGVEIVYRNNHADFMEAAEAMHSYLSNFAETKAYADYHAWSDFEDLRSTFEKIYRNEGNKYERIEEWKEAARSGILGFTEEIPEYDAEAIHDELEMFPNLVRSDDAVDLFAYRFHQAATVHRDYVTKILLPSYDIVVW